MANKQTRPDICLQKSEQQHERPFWRTFTCACIATTVYFPTVTKKPNPKRYIQTVKGKRSNSPDASDRQRSGHGFHTVSTHQKATKQVKHSQTRRLIQRANVSRQYMWWPNKIIVLLRIHRLLAFERNDISESCSFKTTERSDRKMYRSPRSPLLKTIHSKHGCSPT